MVPFIQRHYRTVILACCFLVLFVNQGLPATSFNVYQTYLVELPGVGAVGGSAILTLRAAVSLLVMVIVTPFYRRFDARAGVIAATLCTAAGFAVYGTFPTLAGLLAGSVLTGVGYGLGGMVATTLILGRWFKGGLGTAAGVIGMGSGAASFVIPAVAAEVIEAAGLSAAFYAEAALTAACALLFGLLLRSDPAQLGLEPYRVGGSRHPRSQPTASGTSPAAATGDTPVTPAATPSDSPTPSVPTPSAADLADSGAPNAAPSAAPDAHCRRRPCRNLVRGDLPAGERRLMLIAMTLMGGVAITGFGYFSVLLTSSGISPVAAAVITSLGGGCLMASKFACGRAFDRLGTRAGTLLFFAILLLGLVLCATVGFGGATEGFFAAVAYCTGIAVATTGIAVWSLELSSPERTLRTVRDFNLAYAAGGFVFNMMPGPVFQLTGSYAPAYAVLALFALASAVLIARVYSRRQRSSSPLGPR